MTEGCGLHVLYPICLWLALLYLVDFTDLFYELENLDFTSKDVFNVSHWLRQRRKLFFSREVLSQIYVLPVKAQSSLGVPWNPNFSSTSWQYSYFVWLFLSLSARLAACEKWHWGLKTSVNYTFVLIQYFIISGARKFSFIFVLQCCDKFMFLQLCYFNFFNFQLDFYLNEESQREDEHVHI